MISAGCKINLGLKILGTRSDGFHEISTLFYPLPKPADLINLEKTAASELIIECSRGDIPYQENILLKVWNNFSAVCKPKFGVKINLIKNIPTGAGLGGGSSDAAIFLLWLNSACNNCLTRQQLYDMAFQIGADVPFFLDPFPSHAMGAGEKLQKTGFMGQGLFLILVLTSFKVNSGWAYRRYDELQGIRDTATKGLTKSKELAIEAALSFSKKNFAVDIEHIENDLESVVFAKYPVLQDLKINLINLGAIGSSMSGSGSSIYGIFNSKSKAKEAVKILQKDFPAIYFFPMRNY